MIDGPEQSDDGNGIDEADIPYTQRIFSFLQSLEDKDEIEPVFYLYKYDHPTSGKIRSFIDKFQSYETPEQDEIGKCYGGGRYVVVMVIPPIKGKREGTTRTYTFKIHSRFDDIARRFQPATFQPAGAVPSPAFNPVAVQQNSMVEAFGVLEKFIGLLTPILIPLLTRPKDENVSEMMSNMYSSANDLLRNSMAENFKMLMNMKNHIQSGDNSDMQVETEPEIKEAKPDYLPMIINLLSEWLPKLINGNPVESAALSQVVRATPQFKQLMEDRDGLQKIINFLVQSQGVQNTNKLLQVLKVNKAVSIPEEAAPAPVQARSQAPAAPVQPRSPKPAAPVQVAPMQARGLKQARSPSKKSILEFSGVNRKMKGTK